MSEVRGCRQAFTAQEAPSPGYVLSLWMPTPSVVEQPCVTCGGWERNSSLVFTPPTFETGVWGFRTLDSVVTYVCPLWITSHFSRGGGDPQKQSSIDRKTSWLQKTAVTWQLSCRQRPSLPQLIIFWLPVPRMNSFPAWKSYNGLGFHV